MYNYSLQSYEPEPAYEPEPEQTYEPEPVASPVTSRTPDLLRSNLPPRQDSDAEEGNDQEWEGL